jgi:hypothetical protein
VPFRAEDSLRLFAQKKAIIIAAVQSQIGKQGIYAIMIVAGFLP